MNWTPDADALRGRMALVAGATRGAGRGIAARCLLPLLVTRPGGLHVEVTDGTKEFNDRTYRISVFYDLSKVAVNRHGYSLGQELARFGATAVAVTPGGISARSPRRSWPANTALPISTATSRMVGGI